MPKRGNIPKPRSVGSMVFYENSLYIYGYVPYSEDSNDEIFRYDLTKEEWEIVEVLGERPAPRKSHYSFIHQDEMIVIYGYFEENMTAYNEINKFNFLNKTWKKVEGFVGIPVMGSSSVQINQKVYILYGRNFEATFNSIQSFDLKELVMVQETENFLSPSPRSHHCSIVINQYMYLFGGGNFNEEDPDVFFNDFWRFDLETLTWEFFITSGDAPINRKFYSCCKLGSNRLAVFGGENENTFYNDLYWFYEPKKFWFKVEPLSVRITPRSNSCMVSYINLLFIVGGNSAMKGNNDLWVYQFDSNEFKMIAENLFSSDISAVRVLGC
jgi:N-acetylneuraminic acid mutarotase